MGGFFARTLLPDPVASASYDAANRQLQFGNKQMTFDANGNLKSITDPSGTTTFSWDSRNRLTALTGPGTTASFGYDPFGRRTSKQVNGQHTQYLYSNASGQTVNPYTGLPVARDDPAWHIPLRP